MCQYADTRELPRKTAGQLQREFTTAVAAAAAQGGGGVQLHDARGAKTEKAQKNELLLALSLEKNSQKPCVVLLRSWYNKRTLTYQR